MKCPEQKSLKLIVVVLTLISFATAFAGSKVVRPLGERIPKNPQEAGCV